MIDMKKFFRKKSALEKRMQRYQMKRREDVDGMEFAYSFVGSDKKKYTTKWTTDNDGIDVTIDRTEAGTALYLRLVNRNWLLTSINVQETLRSGFGTAMMLTLFEIITEKTDINTIEGNFVPALDNPDHVLNFYESFGGYKDKKKIIEFEFDGERQKFKYFIKRK